MAAPPATNTNDALLAYALLFHSARAEDQTVAAEFRRLASPTGRLAGLTALSFLFYRSAQPAEPSVEHVLSQTVPQLLPQLSRTTAREQVVLHGRTRGRVDWSGTLKKRYAEDNNPALFVCAQSWRRFDRRENQLLVFMLHQIQACLQRVPLDMRSWQAWNLPFDPDRASALPLGDWLAHLAHLVRSLVAHVHLREVSLPERIEPRHLLAARTSKNELYAEVADLYTLFHSLVEEPNWNIWRRVVERVIHEVGPLPANAHDIGRIITSAGKERSMSDKTIVYSNGIRDDGEYALKLRVDELYAAIIEGAREPDPADKALLDSQQSGRGRLGPPPPADRTPDDLAATRWGIIWPADAMLTLDEREHLAELRQALQELIEYRKQQMGGVQPAEFIYEQGWDFADFLWERARLGLTQMNLRKMPYYLCIVGSPSHIPWEFQQYLDIKYAVGRIWFDDVADCKRYVEHLLAYERSNDPAPTAREAMFVGPQRADDPPTTKTAKYLIEPLHSWFATDPEFSTHPSAFTSSLLLGDRAGQEATKAHVLKRLTGRDLQNTPRRPPALLFSASHGREFPQPSVDQYAGQGALIFQEWRGRSRLEPNEYWSADQVTADLQLAGMMLVCVACFSAGTPRKPDWKRPSLFGGPSDIALKPFVASLPQKLLAHGALAFVGHVSKAWDFSFLGIERSEAQLDLFKTTIGELLRGQPVGHATNYLNQQWAELTTTLDVWKEDRRKSKEEIIDLWLARQDCRGYVVLGDPATRLRVASLQQDDDH